MDKKFLDYTKGKGNDLSSVVKPEDKWCLCEYRWQEAFKDGLYAEGCTKCYKYENKRCY